MRRSILWLGAGLAGGILGMPADKAEAADGYYYEARSYYVVPPVTYPQPILARPPIFVYDPWAAPPPPVYVAPPPPPVAGYFRPLPAPRARETWNYSPWRDRYRYKVDVPGGPDYEFRYKRDGGRIRYREKWD